MDRNELDPSVPSATEVKKIPLIIKVYAVLCILSGVGTLPSVAAFMWQVITALVNGNATEKLGDNTLVAVGLIVAGIMLSAASAVILIIFGLDLIINQRRNAARLSYILIAFTVVELLVDVMLQGIGPFLLRPAIQLGILVALSANDRSRYLRDRPPFLPASDNRRTHPEWEPRPHAGAAAPPAGDARPRRRRRGHARPR